MTKKQEKELLDISQSIAEFISEKDLTLSQELKDEAMLSLESMEFFLSNKEPQRAITEGIKIINKLMPF